MAIDPSLGPSELPLRGVYGQDIHCYSARRDLMVPDGFISHFDQGKQPGKSKASPKKKTKRKEKKGQKKGNLYSVILTSTDGIGAGKGCDFIGLGYCICRLLGRRL